jgi:hypothetical protein
MSQEKSYHIVADGFSSIDVVSYDNQTFQIDPFQEQIMQAFVEKQMERTKAAKGEFKDGLLVGILMDSLKADNQTVQLAMQNIRYFQHAGLFRTNANAPIQAAYVCALVITADNRLVFGDTQFTEAQFMGKLAIPAGGIGTPVNDKTPSYMAQLYKETGEEIGLAGDMHAEISGIIPGWINGMSRREGNYHLTTSFVVKHKFTADQIQKYFNLMRDFHASQGIKTEYKRLVAIPNDKKYLETFIEEADAKGKDSNLQGKSLDVVEEWVRTYDCDPEKLIERKSQGARVYLPQPLI